MIKVTTTGVSGLSDLVAIESKQTSKALLNAIKVEGFSLRQTLANAIRASATAPGARFRDLSIIARVIHRKSIGGGIRTYRPLLRLAGAITYEIDPNALTMKVGFTKRSPLWSRQAALMQQQGFSKAVTPKMRAYFAAKGAEIRGNRTWKGRRKGNPLMLRKDTTRLVIPPRPIVEPFWDYQKNSSTQRIRNHFRTIMSGRVAPGGVLHDVNEMGRW
jgi:hypothetical protein